MGLQESLAKRGITPFTKVRYRTGLGPAFLQGVIMQAGGILSGGKINLFGSGKALKNPNNRTHSDWHSKLEVAEESN